jgi:hypothetical protein
LRPVSAHRLLPLFFFLLALPACGIAFTSSDEGTELFKKLQLSGDFVVGGEMTATVDLNDAYAVPLHVACYVDRAEGLTDDEKKVSFEERARLIGEVYLDAVPGASDLEPGDEGQKRTLTYSFSVEEPGQHFIACITPSAPDNGLGRSFTVRAK